MVESLHEDVEHVHTHTRDDIKLCFRTFVFHCVFSGSCFQTECAKITKLAWFEVLKMTLRFFWGCGIFRLNENQSLGKPSL